MAFWDVRLQLPPAWRQSWIKHVLKFTLLLDYWLWELIILF